MDSNSESSDIYHTPVKRRKVIAPVGNRSKMPSRIVVKREQQTSPLTSSSVQEEEKQWPSDYLALDVIHVLHSCKPPPPRTTIAQHFYTLTGIPFKKSTYYDAWSKWDEATQEQRDNAAECDLWKDFAVHVPLKKAKLKVARQRVRRRQKTADIEEPVIEEPESDRSVESEPEASLDSSY